MAPHGQLWREIESINTDLATECTVQFNLNLPEGLRLKESQGLLTHLDIFLFMYPMAESFEEMLDATNANIQQDNNKEGARPQPFATKGEFVKLLGIRFATILDNRPGAIPVYWKKPSSDYNGTPSARNEQEKTIFLPADFGLPQPKLELQQTAILVNAVGIL